MAATEFDLLKKSALIPIIADLEAVVDPKVAAAEAAQTAAELAETNAAASETAAGTSEANAASSETAAEAAKDAVEAIADFTDGKVYQGDGTGIAALSREDFGKQREVTKHSITGAMFIQSLVLSFDSFVRANSTTLGTSDGGVLWESFGAFNDFEIDNNRAAGIIVGNQYANVLQMPTLGGGNSGGNSLTVNITFAPRQCEAGVIFAVDANNYVLLTAQTNKTIKCIEVVSGVSTIIYQVSPTLLFASNFAEGAYDFIFRNLGTYGDNFYSVEINGQVIQLGRSVTNVFKRQYNQFQKVGIWMDAQGVGTGMYAKGIVINNRPTF
jgi:hypothetical protein